jgi:glutamyl-tRNA reductase
MEISVIGLNHTTAPVEIREKAYFPEDRLAEAYQGLAELEPVQESCILSTCNRVEIYVVSRSSDKVAAAVIEFLCAFHGLQRENLSPFIFNLSSQTAVSHLLGVASSIKSVVIGEGQILGQVRDAYFYARDHGYVSHILNKLFNTALACGKRARSETEIGRGAVSVSQAAIELTREIFADLEKHTVLVIGAGKMSELAAKHLRKRNIGKMVFMNRSRDRADEMVRQYGGISVPFDARSLHMVESDIIISSTSSQETIIQPQEVRDIMNVRGDRPVFFIDLAVPRDVHPDVEKLDNVFLYTVDDLESVVKANLGRREKEIGRVESIVREETEEFNAWYSKILALPTIEKLKAKLDSIRSVAMVQFVRKEKGTGREKDINLDFINRVTEKIVDKISKEVLEGFETCHTDRAWKEYNKKIQEIFKI